ncbi:MAG TPA: tetratricopeptide repeat protein [Noviherbaspirillum sp.]|nr:tetratricopeptide repeat protein [Noviherbaspirillum sp.]
MALFATTLLAASALADEISNVSALLRARQFPTALTQAEAYLQRQPGDPQMRFLKGLILTGMERQAEAISVFTQLSVDYPALPEPYNNLAVLYAASGQYAKARTALEGAVQANPGYARAHENLADIYSQLASQSYALMLQLEPDNANVRAKYDLIRSAIDRGGERLPLNIAGTTVTKPVANSTVSPLARSTETTAADAQPLSDVDVDREEVIATLNEWAKAWSARDVAAYLDFYSPDFRTPGKQPRVKWEAARRARIEDKEFIDVKVLSPAVSIDGDKAKVNFHQNYKSNRVSSNERKVVLLEKQDGSWKIVREGSDK